MGLAVKLSVAAGLRRGVGNICLRKYEQRIECLKSDPPNFTFLSGLSTDFFVHFPAVTCLLYTPPTNFFLMSLKFS